jgi:hypothetical protein
MINKLTLAAAILLGAAPAFADATFVAETRIPRIRNFIEWVYDTKTGVYIRAETGRWYYARTQAKCARLRPTATLSFQATANGDLDKYGALRVEGWRCPLASVVESGPPPRRRKH